MFENIVVCFSRIRSYLHFFPSGSHLAAPEKRQDYAEITKTTGNEGLIAHLSDVSSALLISFAKSPRHTGHAIVEQGSRRGSVEGCRGGFCA